MLSDCITIENDGPQLVCTNYWETHFAERGALFCSVNAGAVRILVPKTHEHFIEHMHSGREVLVTRGDWAVANRRDALELMWEDDSDTPFVIHLSPQQLDRPMSGTDAGRHLRCLVYVRGFAGTPLLRGDWPARFRLAPLPCMLPWGK